jgi:hypothetical protein
VKPESAATPGSAVTPEAAAAHIADAEIVDEGPEASA